MSHFIPSLRRLSTIYLPVMFLAACQVNTLDTTARETPQSLPAVSVATRTIPKRQIRVPRTTPAPADETEELQYTSLWQRLSDNLSLYQEYEHPSIDEELAWYLDNPGYISQVTERAAPFLFAIVSEVEDRGMPLDLALLPIVESAFDPNAYSHQHAVGLWQFMGPTARSYGLQTDWWYDGRRDPLASTRAALDYLDYLYQQFDSNWLLALAAYNAGEGNVQRALRRSGKEAADARFWELRLPKETRGHIPKLLAAAHLIANAEEYGLKLAELPDEPFLETVELEFQIDLDTAAQIAAVDTELLKTLNAGYLQWATHPQHPQSLVLPRANAALFREAVADLTLADRPSWDFYQIERGDTLSTIARRFKTRVAVLQSINGLRGTRIVAGQTLMVPRSGVPSVASLAGLADFNANQETDLREPTPTSYRVDRGDSLWRIASRFGLKSNDIAAWNNISINSLLQPGQVLILQPRGYVASSSGAGADNGSPISYEVNKGDTLYDIARQFKVSVSELIDWNNLEPTATIFPGQRIEIIMPSASVN